MKFAFKNFYRPLPKPLISLMEGLKAFLGTLALLSYFSQDRPDIAAGFLAFGAFVDFVIKFFGEAPIQTLENAAKRLEKDHPQLDVKIKINENE